MNSFQHFDSGSPAFKFFRTGHTYAFVLTEKLKNQRKVRFVCLKKHRSGTWDPKGMFSAPVEQSVLRRKKYLPFLTLLLK